MGYDFILLEKTDVFPKAKSRLLLFTNLLLKGTIVLLMCLLVTNCTSNESCQNTPLEYKGHVVSFPASVKDAMYSYGLNFKEGALIADTAVAESQKIVAYYRRGYDDRYIVNDNIKDELLHKGIYSVVFMNWQTNDTQRIAEQLKNRYKRPMETKTTRFQKITYYEIPINRSLSVIVFDFFPIKVAFCYRLTHEETDRFVETNGNIILD